MFDLLKEAYLIPKRFHGKAGENPILHYMLFFCFETIIIESFQ